MFRTVFPPKDGWKRSLYSWQSMMMMMEGSPLLFAQLLSSQLRNANHTHNHLSFASFISSWNFQLFNAQILGRYFSKVKSCDAAWSLLMDAE